MKSEHKMISIIAVWLATFGAMAMLFIGRNVDLGTGVLAFFILTFAAISTTEIADAKLGEQPQTQSAKDADKAKKRESKRVDKLLSSLNDDDLEVLRRRRAADEMARIGDDGELVTLEQVMRGRQ